MFASVDRRHVRLVPEKPNRNLEWENTNAYLEAFHSIFYANICNFGWQFQFRSTTAQAGGANTATAITSTNAERHSGLARGATGQACPFGKDA